MLRLLNKSVGAMIMVVLTWLPNFAVSQHYETYPEWVAERFCAAWADKAACRGTLTVESLNNGDAEGQFPRITTCTYDHPTQPWDYTDECFFTMQTSATVFTYRIGVKNGSSVAISIEMAGANAGRVLFNGTVSRSVERGQGVCVQTLVNKEVFCLLTPPEQRISSQEGSCRLTGNGGQFLENCSEERVCRDIPAAGESICEVSYVWASGRRTFAELCESFFCTINGHTTTEISNLSPDWGGNFATCAIDGETGQEFCFSREPLVVAAAPVLKETLRSGKCTLAENGVYLLGENCQESALCLGENDAQNRRCSYDYTFENGYKSHVEICEGRACFVDGHPTELGPQNVVWGDGVQYCTTDQLTHRELCFSS